MMQGGGQALITKQPTWVSSCCSVMPASLSLPTTVPFMSSTSALVLSNFSHNCMHPQGTSRLMPCAVQSLVQCSGTSCKVL